MIEKEGIRYSTNVPWKDVPQLLIEGEIDLVIVPVDSDRCVIEFTDNLPERLREGLGNFERNAQIISGQNPSVIQIYTKKGISGTKVSDFLAEWLHKEGMELREV
ncbi:hypothetical protein KKH23_02730 [Patescibacteria group bacterium]|nr:hypothetical protein [Patescibacteria group bacterium]MBU0777334.1 hypothetical protein [Patescibacteria group bacterium]MBU0846086.1 hypothetical protein [Patescibacteria group bacterium]MBU0923139.1 hypothetical protein [Patescibacteria group bacterium]MBU1066854.1 hypothetical protein [Patescibacteria group bacterium]